jgi:hypothetical protein
MTRWDSLTRELETLEQRIATERTKGQRSTATLALIKRARTERLKLGTRISKRQRQGVAA